MEKRKNAGFTLLELIVAVALLGLAMGPLMGTFMNAIKTNSLSRITLKGTYLAEYMEERFHQFTYEEYEKTQTDPNRKDMMAPLFPAGATIGDIVVKTVEGGFEQTLKFVNYSNNNYTVVITVADERTDRDTNTSKYFVYTVKVDVYRYSDGTVAAGATPLVSLKGGMPNKE